MLLQQKASEAETEVQRIKLSVIKTEEERLHMEKRVGETELIVHRMVEEAERRQHEAETLRKEVSKAREAEKEAKGKLIEFLNTSMTDVSKSSPTWHGNTAIAPSLTPNGEEHKLSISDLCITLLLYCREHPPADNPSRGPQPHHGRADTLGL